MKIEQLLMEMVKAVVDHPERVTIEESTTSGQGDGKQDRLLEIVVADEDVGQVVGKKGQTLAALRRIVEAATVREHHRDGGWVEVSLRDPRDRADRQRPESQGRDGSGEEGNSR